MKGMWSGLCECEWLQVVRRDWALAEMSDGSLATAVGEVSSYVSWGRTPLRPGSVPGAGLRLLPRKGGEGDQSTPLLEFE